MALCFQGDIINLQVNKNLFDLYVPTRDSQSIEVRLRSATNGPVSLHINGSETFIDQSVILYQGLHFYRYQFSNLQADTVYQIEASHLSNDSHTAVTTSTLASPPGRARLSIGLLADLHLTGYHSRIDDYRPGTKRLLGLSHELSIRYIKRLETLGVDIIVLPGDLVDPCTPETLDLLKNILNSVSIPCYPIIGNHEPWTSGGEALFYQALGLPEHGYYAVSKNGIRLLMLSTPAPNSLHTKSAQFLWLKEELDHIDPNEDVVLFSHFSLLLHPCNQGSKNDGYQLLDNHVEILDFLSEYPNVRLFVAGHKNVPSIVEKAGIIHMLSPQLIQAPCGYDILKLYDHGAMRMTYEIEEQHYCEVARAAYADNWCERFGSDDGRNFYITYK